ncbi:MAG TPA: SDR family oxidoreductase [Acetobacteraceae bacterium]|nr:SDR family oxidoreductase [Acetobacteraceae bacterium]
MDLGLNGKTALVLGGTAGLGRAIALSLAGEGAKVAVAGRNKEKLARIEGELGGKGRGLALEWDLSDRSLIEPRVAQVEAALGPVDILVNNTGGPPPTPAAGQPPELWLKNFEALVLSVIAITDRVLPGMRSRRWGRIITSTSSGIVAPIPNLAMSNALRLSLVGWSKTLAREVAGEGVTVNIILPGRIATDRLSFLDEQRAKREGRPVEEVERESRNGIPAGRYGDPAEYGDTVAFLASTRAGYITGSTIRVDGGLIPSI